MQWLLNLGRGEIHAYTNQTTLNTLPNLLHDHTTVEYNKTLFNIELNLV